MECIEQQDFQVSPNIWTAPNYIRFKLNIFYNSKNWTNARSLNSFSNAYEHKMFKYLLRPFKRQKESGKGPPPLLKIDNQTQPYKHSRFVVGFWCCNDLDWFTPAVGSFYRSIHKQVASQANGMSSSNELDLERKQ